MPARIRGPIGIEQAMDHTRFSEIDFSFYHTDSDGILFTPKIKDVGYGWLMRISNSEYDSWGRPESITGEQILEYRNKKD